METNVPIQPGLFRVIRILRVGRLLRFVEAARGVRQLIFTITKSAPALSNVGTLLFLVVFIYAILGMSMFGNVKYSKYITPVTNFETWFSSMCLLFRVATAAGWNNVLEGLSIAPPYCDPDKIIPGGGGGITQGDCGNKAVAIVYLVTYMFLIVQFVVNMYIAVILENFNDAQNQENIGITEDAVEDFYEVWKEFDPKAKQLISYDDLGDFLDQVCDPFRIEKPNEWFLETLKCPMREGKKIHCLDLLQILIKKIIGDDKCVVDETTEKVMIKLEKKFKKKFPARNKKEIVGTTDERYFLELDASRKIQRTARWYFMLNDINLLMRQQKITAQNDAEQTIKRIEQSLRALLKTKARRIEKPKIQFTLSNEDDNDNDELFEDSDENHIVETPLL